MQASLLKNEDLCEAIWPHITAWSQVLQQLLPRRFACALELCCGISPKVGAAIDALQLAQTMLYLDADRQALSQCALLCRTLNLQTRCCFLAQSLSHYRGRQVDLLVGNHIIDDLFMHYWLADNPHNATQPFQSKETFLTACAQLVALYSCRPQHAVQTLVSELDSLLQPGGILVLSDYASVYEQEYGMDDWPRLRQRLMHAAKVQFLAKGYQPVAINTVPGLFSSLYCWQKTC